MTKRTRVFLFASAGVLVAALTTALIAWAGGVSVLAALGSDGPAELAYVPGTAQMVAYADVRQVMNSPFHDRLTQYQQNSAANSDSIESRTGIKFDRDVDRLLVASVGSANAAPKDRSLVIARGRFDPVRIEGLMREQGAQVYEYRGKRVVSIQDATHDATLVFPETGLLVFGAREGVRAALDAQAGAVKGIDTNTEFMNLVHGVDDGTAWTVAKFDELAQNAQFGTASAVMGQLPPINWLAASGRVDSGLHGLVRAEARDEQSAENLRDVVQGFLALARMQGTREPAYKGMLDTVALTADGKSVSLSFELTPAMLDRLTPNNALRPDTAPRR